ncbi:MAG TPA: LacI family DNA-binding transcriptional regulator [Atribacteraceae bacterium]|nr:LacI family DNA-binding transcriptional regulator [Atribacteraceae bacterium]
MKKNLTIQDIAQEAGVSKSTVSRILNNSSNVSPQTRERVSAIILKRRYRPNFFARGLSGLKAGVIGVVVTDITNPFYALLVKGIEDVCRNYRYSVFLCNTDGREEEERAQLESLTQRGVDGVILASTMLDDQSMRDFQEKGLQLVLLARLPQDPRPYEYVVTDNVMGGHLATKHLLSLGHRRIAFLSGPWLASPSHDRFAGYRRALEEALIAVDERWVLRGDFKMESGSRAVQLFLQLPPPRPTALFAANDAMAMGVLESLAELGVKVPEELSVIGFDDTPLGGLHCVQLTTISQSIAEQGALSARMLVERITQSKKSEPRHVVLPPKLIIRKTTARPRPGR